MHNCRETKERVTELLLDGHDCLADGALAAELRRCAECSKEFDVLNATLRMTARSRELSAPTEDYWAGYNARLRQRIENCAEEFHAKAQRRKERPVFSFAPLRLWVRTSVPVPVPLIAVVILAFAAISVFAIVTARQPVIQSPRIVQVAVEVPVTKEKIVTRVVYRERRSLARTSKRISNTPKVDGTFAKSQNPAADILAGFKPTEEVKLTVIKGGSTNEK